MKDVAKERDKIDSERKEEEEMKALKYECVLISCTTISNYCQISLTFIKL